MRPAIGLLSASCAGIFLELLLIRYLGSEIPILAYFKNFPLLAAFLGLGAGCLLADRRRPYLLSGIASLGLLILLVSRAGRFGWDQMGFPDPHIDIWGRFLEAGALVSVWRSAGNLLVIFLLLAACCWSFVWIGQTVGQWLKSGPPLRMYALDIAGSLLGVLGFAWLSFAQTSPLAWLSVAAGLLLMTMLLRGIPARRVLVPAGLLAVTIAGVAGQDVQPGVGKRWSPYYAIETRTTQLSADPLVVMHTLRVNKDFHQVMLDLSDRVGRETEPETQGHEWWKTWRIQYDLPYYFQPEPGSVLIGGAGSGNDAAAALRHHAAAITAIEIDPAIVQLGRELHPEKPYDSPAVRIVETDVRSYLRKSKERFDLIVYSVLDSHTALSALSSLRLDNYVYTVEGIRDAVSHLAPQGVMSVSFFEGPRLWLGARLARAIELATGRLPLATRFQGRVYFFFGDGLNVAVGKAILRDLSLPSVEYRDPIEPATDDWPFLYTSPRGQPWVYYLSLVLLVAGGAGLVRWIFSRAGSGEGRLGMDWPMFFLGAGFLLVETKALAELALLFGSTWVVNTFVFGGIFVMVLLSILAVRLGAGRWLKPVFILLAAALLAWYVFPRSTLNALEYWPRAFVGTGLVVLPVFFAGIVFAALFARRPLPSVAFGSNLIGAVVGGAAEAASLTWGIRALTLLALAFYAVAWWLTERRATAR